MLFILLLVISILKLHIQLVITEKSQRQLVKFRARRTFCQRTNRIFGVRLVTYGTLPPEGTYLFISNHRSFYDPIAFLSYLIANPVSKAEVSRYPIIGWGARLTEVLMLDRTEMSDRRRMKYRIFESLRDGTSILLYPEGTTTKEKYTGDFKKGAFESAIRAERAVIPIAMEYPDENHYWIDRPLFAQFLHQIVTRQDNRIFLAVGQPIMDSQPLELLKKTKTSIDMLIRELRDFRNARKTQ